MELDANIELSDGAEGRFVTDLNKEPDFSAVTNSLFDAATCVVSIDYLTQPREVLGSLRRVVKEGATVNVVVSNPCFPTKTIARWLKIGEEERLNMVADYLYFPGWSNVEIVDLRDNNGDEGHRITLGWLSS